MSEFHLRIRPQPSVTNICPIVILDSLCVLGVLSLGSPVCTPVYPSMWTGYSSASTDTSTLPRWRLSVVRYLYASHKFYLTNKSDQNSSFQFNLFSGPISLVLNREQYHGDNVFVRSIILIISPLHFSELCSMRVI